MLSCNSTEKISKQKSNRIENRFEICFVTFFNKEPKVTNLGTHKITVSFENFRIKALKDIWRVDVDLKNLYFFKRVQLAMNVLPIFNLERENHLSKNLDQSIFSIMELQSVQSKTNFLSDNFLSKFKIEGATNIIIFLWKGVANSNAATQTELKCWMLPTIRIEGANSNFWKCQYFIVMETFVQLSFRKNSFLKFWSCKNFA